MRLAKLYLRSRLAGHAILCLSGVAVLGFAGAWWLLSQPYADARQGALTPVLLFGPLAAACVLGVSAYSPFGDIERSASRSLPVLRFAYLGALLAYALLTLFVVASRWNLPYAELSIARNLLGLSGLAFLAACILGPRLSWVLPLTYSLLIPLVGRGSSGEEFVRWAWPVQPASDPLSGVTAIVLFAVGFGVVCLYGTRDAAEDTQ